MGNEGKRCEQAVLKAVERYAYKRYRHLSISDLDGAGFDEEEIDRIKSTKEGYLDFTVENMEVETDGDETTYHVSATIMFQTNDEPIEGSTDTYKAYQDSNSKWIIDWHSS